MQNEGWEHPLPHERAARVGKIEYAPGYAGGYVRTTSSDARHITVDELLPRRRDPWEQWHQPPLTAANDNMPANWPKVVAFTGLAGSGKSTAADYLVGMGYQRVKFAGPLKAMMRAMGLGEAHIEGDLKEVPTPLLAGRTPRHAMQTLGTDWGRDLIGPTLWTGLWHSTVSDVLDHGGRVVCDDCRFPNEVDTVRGVGGVVVRLEGRGGIAGGHASERQEFPVDCAVVNAGGIGDLHERLRDVLPLVGQLLGANVRQG